MKAAVKSCGGGGVGGEEHKLVAGAGPRCRGPQQRVSRGAAMARRRESQRLKMAFEEKEEAKAPPCGLYGRRGGSGMHLWLCGSVWPRVQEGQPANQRKGSWRKRRGVRRGGQALQLCQVARGLWVPAH